MVVASVVACAAGVAGCGGDGTHWRFTKDEGVRIRDAVSRPSTDCARWQESPAYRQIADLGQVRSTLFVIVPERGARLGLRADRMQREWVAKE